MKEVILQVEGLKIKGNIFPGVSGEDKQPAVLLIHGWESAQDRMFGLAEELSAKGYYCMTIDMRGHGASEGDHKVCSRKEFLNDVLAAYDFLVVQEQVDPNRVMAVGSSFGSYMAALLSAERSLQGIVLRVPANYRDIGFDEPLYTQRKQGEHSQWKNNPHANDETAALRAVHAFSGHILVVESEKDELVPSTTVRSYKDAAPDPFKLSFVTMSNAPHSISRFPEFQKEFNATVSTWLESLK